MPPLNSDKVDEGLWAAFLDFLSQPGRLLQSHFDQLNSANDVDSLREQADALRQSVAKLKKQKAKLLTLFLETDAFDKDELVAKTRDLESQRTLDQAELDRLSAALADYSSHQAKAESVKEQLGQYKGWLKMLAIGTKLRDQADLLPFEKKLQFLRAVLGDGKIWLLQMSREALLANCGPDADTESTLQEETLGDSAKGVMPIAWEVEDDPAGIVRALAEVGVFEGASINSSIGTAWICPPWRPPAPA